MELRAQGKGAGAPEVEELRDYGGGAQILSELGVHDMILLTNTHHTLVGLEGYGLSIVGERPIPGTMGE
jgi:3,4-dihydroxy 2-butanone 4-phosphate synthase / GTP cyclohydrolase II